MPTLFVWDLKSKILYLNQVQGSRCSIMNLIRSYTVDKSKVLINSAITIYTILKKTHIDFVHIYIKKCKYNCIINDQISFELSLHQNIGIETNILQRKPQN